MINERELFRYIGSNHNLIATRQICEVQRLVDRWILMNSCGAIVCGPSRCGKTCAINYISKHLKETYGNALPVYVYTATDHVPTQKTFYESLLLKLGHSEASKGNANQMRIRIVNRLISEALNTKYQMVILFIDEAYLLHEKELTWLIDIYNELNLNDVLLTVIMFGTEELKDMRNGFIKKQKQQIVQRFMKEVVEFHGIENELDLGVCLASIDSSVTLQGDVQPIVLSKEYFPNAYAEGYTLASSTQDFWGAVESLRQKNKIATNYLTMKCFVDTLMICLHEYGINAGEHSVYAPTQEIWEKCLIDAGFVLSQV